MSAPSADAGQAFFLGLKLYEWLTLVGIVIGPIAAVLITLTTEHARRIYERRMQVLRAILATRRLFSDPAYTASINLIPVEFNSKSAVMAAWREYTISVRPDSNAGMEDAHIQRMLVKQAELISAMMEVLGLRHTQSEIQTEMYISRGFLERDSILAESQKAMPEIANALKRQNQLTEDIIRRSGQQPPPVQGSSGKN